MYNHWSNFIPAILAIAYIAYVVIRVSRSTTSTCPTCGRTMLPNPDPALTTCWACEQEELHLNLIRTQPAYDWAKEGN